MEMTFNKVFHETNNWILESSSRMTDFFNIHLKTTTIIFT
jgi:hypothetical protein